MDYNARLGLTWATALLRVTDGGIEVRQTRATLAVGAALPIAPRYRAGLELALATSGYQSKQAGAPTVDLGTVRTGSVTLGLDGPVAQGLRWRAGVGLLLYRPTEDRGIFLRGGTTRFLAGAGIDYQRPIMARWDMIASLRYDCHRFTPRSAARGLARARVSARRSQHRISGGGTGEPQSALALVGLGWGPALLSCADIAATQPQQCYEWRRIVGTTIQSFTGPNRGFRSGSGLRTR